MRRISSQHSIHPMSSPGTPTTTPSSLPAPSLPQDRSTSMESKNSSSNPSSITRGLDEDIDTLYTFKAVAQRTTAGFPGANLTTTRLLTSTGRTTLLISHQPTPTTPTPDDHTNLAPTHHRPHLHIA